ncbi:MAG: hypothetical protein RJA70_1605 [Pseudomonadota bacterium]
MTVVILITVLTAIALPLVTQQLRDRKVHEAAIQVSDLYRIARTRAMGRGSAVLVRFTPGTRGAYTMLEARRSIQTAAADDSGATCGDLSIPSCTQVNWNGTAGSDFQVVTGFDPAAVVEDAPISVTMANDGDTAITNLDVCYTPMGRTFTRTDATQPLMPLNNAYTAEVFRSAGGTRLGREHRVLVLPNGTSRLTL